MNENLIPFLLTNIITITFIQIFFLNQFLFISIFFLYILISVKCKMINMKDLYIFLNYKANTNLYSTYRNVLNLNVFIQIANYEQINIIK